MVTLRVGVGGVLTAHPFDFAHQGRIVESRTPKLGPVVQASACDDIIDARERETLMIQMTMFHREAAVLYEPIEPPRVHVRRGEGERKFWLARHRLASLKVVASRSVSSGKLNNAFSPKKNIVENLNKFEQYLAILKMNPARFAPGLRGASLFSRSDAVALVKEL